MCESAILGLFVAHQQEVVSKIMTCAQNLEGTKAMLEEYKRKRREKLKRILFYQTRKTMLFAAFLHTKTPRSIWSHRHGKFWELDVPSNDADFFKESFRMDRSCFNILVNKLGIMKRSHTSFRDCIPLEKRVAIALYTLRSSAEYQTIGRLFGVSKASVCNILLEFCAEVWNVLAPEYINGEFLNQEKISECVQGFEQLGFPQCFGAVDGCHIEVRPSSEDCVDYYNYKGWYSTVLLALVDYRYRFLYINVGCPGRCNDSQIFEKSSLKQILKSPLFKANSKVICGVNVPVVILGDSAFRFSECLMKPYPFCITASGRERSFNYALSKSRRVVENSFGHLKARFRRIGKGIDNDIQHASLIIKCCCVLHNFLNEHNNQINKKWYISQKNFEKKQKKNQPDSTDTFTDFDPRAETIRKAISIFVSAEHEGRQCNGESVGSEVDGFEESNEMHSNGVDERNNSTDHSDSDG